MMEELNKTAKALMADHKGLLAMDESTGTCNKRFAEYGIPQTIEMRRKYRELLVTTPGLNESISGAILFDETIRQQTKESKPFIEILTEAGIIPGIKVDLGAKPLAGFAGEKITEGLDGLRERFVEYKEMGARFAKWRAVISISEGTPTSACMVANAHALARYAKLCQEVGLVPIVEPEILMDGEHSIEKCLRTTGEMLHIVFNQLYAQQVDLAGIILKPNMILSGLESKLQATDHEIAKYTTDCLLASVPATVPGIAFLSGGQSPELASKRLNLMNKDYGEQLPWALTFSFGRALQQPALAIWLGEDQNMVAAQKALYDRAKCNREANLGNYISPLI